MTYRIHDIPNLISSPLPHPENEAQRLFHGRGHAWPGLESVSVDWLPPVVLITVFSDMDQSSLQQLAAALHARMPQAESIQVQYRNLRHGPVELLAGKPMTSLVVNENGLKYEITLGTNRNTGLFLDMRLGRSWVHDISAGKSLLNLFAYTCGFSVAAVKGGARRVINVDTSSPALSQGRENHKLNRQSMLGVNFEKVDVFKSFGRLVKKGPYEVLISDPPTLQKGSVDIERDYPKILRRLDQLMTPEADLLLCLNAPHLPAQFLIDAVQTHAQGFYYVEQLRNPPAYVDANAPALKALHFKRG